MRLFFVASLAVVVPTVTGWGNDGHRIITSLALDMMRSPRRESLLEPLGDLMKASTWADSEESEKLYPLSGYYHFSNTPYRKCARFDMNRDCGFGKTKGICIVTGLSEAISKAIDPNTSASTRTDSLKFILHLIADIHQPLHTGFREDSGGLRVILGDPDGVDLHAIWDTRLIQELRASIGSSDEISHLTTKLEANNGSLPRKISALTNFTEIFSSESRIMEYVAGLASETATTTTCRLAYMGLNSQWIGVGDSLSAEYYSSRIPTVMVQVLKASVRLGLVLDAIADTLHVRRSLMKEARKAKRISNLFDRPPVTEISYHDDPHSTNRFAPLFIQFDPDTAEIIPPVTGSSSGSSVAAVSRKGERATPDDDTLLGESVALAAKQRSSYIFFGVDLSDIALSKKNGVWLVSTRANLAIRDRELPMFLATLLLTDKRGNIQKQDFAFDATVFPDKYENELLIRTVLRVSGIDPRIDITEYLELIKEVRGGKMVEEPPHVLGAIYYEYLLKTRNTTVSVPTVHHLRSQQGKIYLFRLPKERIHVFVHAETLEQRKKSPVLRTRFNQYTTLMEKTKTGDLTTVLVDPAIFYGSLIPDHESGIVNFKILYKVARISMPSVSREADLLLKEISEVVEAKKKRVVGKASNYNLSGKYVEWFFEHHGEDGPLYFVYDWFSKGTTLDQIYTDLKIDQYFSKPTFYTGDASSVGRRRIFSIEPTFNSLRPTERVVESLRRFAERLYTVSTRLVPDDPADAIIGSLGQWKLYGFNVGNLKAFFADSTTVDQLRIVHKFVQRTVNSNCTDVAEPVVYLLDPRISNYFRIPLETMSDVTSELERIVSGRWNAPIPSRPTVYAELVALASFLSPTNHSPLPVSRAMMSRLIRYVYEYAPPGAPYGTLMWQADTPFPEYM